MAQVTLLRATDYIRQPWKNGGGTTTELARKGDADRWLWRLSVADVERSGPFSDFTGYRRLIVLLEGPGMTLSFDNAAPVVLDERYRPFVFDGGSRTRCDLVDGPIRDMNLIVDAARVDASLDVCALDEGASLRAAASECALLHAIGGRFGVTIGADTVALSPGDTLHVDECHALPITATALDPHAVLAQAAIGYRPYSSCRPQIVRLGATRC
jgi:environmental stress-induced protein Ves